MDTRILKIKTMSIFRLLSSLPRPILHNKCVGCNGCKLSSEHIIPISMLRELSISEAKHDPHNIFLICHSLNKKKGNGSIQSSQLYRQLTDEGKGIIARAILYMEYKYHIPPHDKDLFLLWVNLYPPSDLEKSRYLHLRDIYGINPLLE